MNPKTYLIEKRFGRLVVEADHGSRVHGMVMWTCLCDCGKHKVVSTNDLHRGHCKSCGCLGAKRFKDLSGCKFGFLTAIKRIGTTAKRPQGGVKAIWECLCDCGVVVNVASSRLITGKTKSCGCSKRIRIGERLFGSYLEAATWLRLSAEHKDVIAGERYPGIRLMFDFFVPATGTYFEVTSFTDDCRWILSYLEKIEFKRRYVEDVLGKKFEFIRRPPTRDEYEAVWSVMDHSHRTVRKFSKPRSESEAFWVGLDWNLSNVDLALATGFSIGAVAARRKRHSGTGWMEVKDRKWAGADWSKSDGELAREYGYSTMGILTIRRRLGIRSSYIDKVNADRERRWDGTDWSLGNKALAMLLGRSANSVRNARKRLGIANPHSCGATVG